MPSRNKLIIAIETNPLKHVNFHLRDGTLKSLKVFMGRGDDSGKLFVQCELCGTFISLGPQRSLKNMETHHAKKNARTKGSGKKKS